MSHLYRRRQRSPCPYERESIIPRPCTDSCPSGWRTSSPWSCRQMRTLFSPGWGPKVVKYDKQWLTQPPLNYGISHLTLSSISFTLFKKDNFQLFYLYFSSFSLLFLCFPPKLILPCAPLIVLNLLKFPSPLCSSFIVILPSVYSAISNFPFQF
jgi:hypothetical protein